MIYTYWLHEKIQTDFNEAFTWYEDKQEGLGYEFLNAVEKKIAEIIALPKTFGSKGNRSYREALVDRFPYIIVYKIYSRKREIFVCAVHHAKKSPRKKYRSP